MGREHTLAQPQSGVGDLPFAGASSGGDLASDGEADAGVVLSSSARAAAL